VCVRGALRGLNGAVVAVACDACSLWSVTPNACGRCSLLVVRVRVVQATSVAVVGVQSRIADAYTKGTQTEEPWGTAGPGMPKRINALHTHPTHTYSVAHASILRSGKTRWRQERLSVVQKHPLVTQWPHFVGFCFARAFACVHLRRPRHSRRARHFLPGPVYAHPTHQLCGGRRGWCFLSPAPTQLYVLACLSVHASQWRRRGRRLLVYLSPALLCGVCDKGLLPWYGA